MAVNRSIQVRHELLTLRMAARGEFGVRMGLRGPQAFNHLPEGLGLMFGWLGDRMPQGSIVPRQGSPNAAFLGFSAPDDPIGQFAGEQLAEGVWNVAPVRLRGWGRFEIDYHNVQTVQIDSNGDAVWRPNAPAGLQAVVRDDFTVRLWWVYSAINEQLATVSFDVFKTDGVTAFNFGSPAANVTKVDGPTRFEWIDTTPLGVGETRTYTVRGRSQAGVLSLIPRVGKPPSPDPDSVSLSDSVQVTR